MPGYMWRGLSGRLYQFSNLSTIPSEYLDPSTGYPLNVIEIGGEEAIFGAGATDGSVLRGDPGVTAGLSSGNFDFPPQPFGPPTWVPSPWEEAT